MQLLQERNTRHPVVCLAVTAATDEFSNERVIMSKYTNWDFNESYPTQISADEGTIANRFRRNEIQVQAPSAGDLQSAIEWLALYDAGTDDDSVDSNVQALANVIAFLDMTVSSKYQRQAVNEAKRAFAQQNNVKFNQVRLIKKGN